jgi:hypothetical protein
LYAFIQTPREHGNVQGTEQSVTLGPAGAQMGSVIELLTLRPFFWRKTAESYLPSTISKTLMSMKFVPTISCPLAVSFLVYPEEPKHL